MKYNLFSNTEHMEGINYGPSSRKRKNKDVSRLFVLVWSIKVILMIVLVNISNGFAYANEAQSNLSYCEWVEDVAIAITQNKENGIDEYTLIGKVLDTNTDYFQQLVIIPMIDRIYHESQVSSAELAWREHHECEYSTVNYSN